MSSTADILPVSVGIGIFYNFLLFEWLGLSAGSLVVPGYFALALIRPADCLLTWGLGIMTHGVVRFISRAAVIYGRRQMGLNIVIGYLFVVLTKWLTQATSLSFLPGVSVIGFIIPGLIANSLFNHGFVATTCELVICSIATRLTLILLLGGDCSL